MTTTEKHNKLFVSQEVSEGLCPEYITKALESTEFQYQLDQNLLLKVSTSLKTLATDKTFTPVTSSILVEIDEFKQGSKPLEIIQGNKTWLLPTKDFSYIKNMMHLKISAVINSPDEESKIVITDLATGYTSHFLIEPSVKIFVIDTPIMPKDLQTYLRA